MVAFLGDVLARPQVPQGGWPSYIAVSAFAVKMKLVDRLPAPARTRASDMYDSVQLVQRIEKASAGKLPELVRRAIDYHAKVEPPVHRWLGSQLPAVLLRLDGTTLAELLLKVPSELRRHYRERLTEALQPRSADLGLATHTFEAYHLLSGPQPDHARKLDAVLTATVARWKSRDLEALEKLLAHSKVDGLAEHVAEWREARVPRGIGRFLPRRR
jgi:hypothetical protein